MRLLLIVSLFFTLIHAQAVEASWILKRTRDQNKKITEVGVVEISDQAGLVPQTLSSLPEFLVEHQKSSSSTYEEILWPQAELPASYARFAVSSQLEMNDADVRVIREQGPAKNRICLTFVGDGYLISEKEKFFADVAALVDDLFKGKTFQSYTALFNIYAVFVPSKESGITDLQRKNTAFGLYRNPPGSKRAIMPSNTLALDQAFAQAPKTDYPIVIANDDFYGGLGGRYAITTRSRESGRIVLRHELGHNFGSVGEEYDGGSVYTGANNSYTPNIPWKQWLKEQQSKVVNDMRFLGGAYVWQNLAQSSVVQDFTFPAPTEKGPFWFEVQLSSVGWQNLSDVEILLDGNPLVIEGQGTSDRSFFNTRKIQNLPAGSHKLEIREVKHDGDNILAFANLYAYEADYDFSGGIGAFKTYDDSENLTYRPTHQNCIMRDMLYEFFCAVDQENMWLKFLNRVRLIDQVAVSPEKIEVQMPALSGLTISWFKKENNDEQELTTLKNKTLVPRLDLKPGTYIVRVSYLSPEIRKTSAKMNDEQSFSVP